MTGRGEEPPNGNVSTVKAISRQINQIYFAVAVLVTVMFSIAALALWNVGYLTFLLFYHGLLLPSWLFARWYILRGRDADQVVERFNRLFNPHRRRWDAYLPSPASGEASDHRYSKADAFWFVGGIAALAALLLIVSATVLWRLT